MEGLLPDEQRRMTQECFAPTQHLANEFYLQLPGNRSHSSFHGDAERIS